MSIGFIDLPCLQSFASGFFVAAVSCRLVTDEKKNQNKSKETLRMHRDLKVNIMNILITH